MSYCELGLGCLFSSSTHPPTHPYKTRDTENIPLQPILTGSGACKKNEDCSPGGECSAKGKTACACRKGWTGP